MARTKSGEKKKRQQSVQKRDEMADDEFEVEKIVDKKGAGKSLLYMVKWRGYPESDNTWESPSDLPDNLVSNYLKKKGSDKKTPKKSPKKAAKAPAREKKPVVVTNRVMRDNVVHYEIRGRQKPVPIYEFDDFEPVYEYEMNAPTKTEDVGRLEPARILEKRGTKYHVLWEGKAGLKTWETTKTLICVPLMKEFDERDGDDSEDEIYEVKEIIGKRKNGRVYEYEVRWKGQDADNSTWEPEENLSQCRDKIRAFEKAEARRLKSQQDKKAMQREKAAEKRASKGDSSEASPKKRGRPAK